MINTISQNQYEQSRPDRIGASELEPTGRYDAHLKTGRPDPSAYAVADFVKVMEVTRDGQDFRVIVASVDSGMTRNCRISLNGIVYGIGVESTVDEQGYFKNPPLGDAEYELDELISKLEPIQIERHKPEPLKYLAMPLPPQPNVDPKF